MEEVIKYLQDFGFSKKMITKILTHHSFISYSNESLYNRITENISWLKNNGYTNEEIIKMVNRSYRHLLIFSLEHMERRRQFFLKLGYTNVEFLKILKTFPSILSTSPDIILEKVNYFLDLGITKEEFIKKSLISPNIFAYSIQRIKAREQLFLKLGYSKEEYQKIIKTILALIGYEEQSILIKFNLLLSMGYSQKEVIRLTTEFPALYAQSDANLEQKITFLKNIGLEKAILRNPKNLMMSINLLQGRWEFLQEQGIIIDKEHYSLLFIKNKRFSQHFGITKEELLEKYSKEALKRSE